MYMGGKYAASIQYLYCAALHCRLTRPGAFFSLTPRTTRYGGVMFRYNTRVLVAVTARVLLFHIALIIINI